MEKFELLYGILASLHKEDVLKDCVLIGSWCQDFYRHMFGNPFQIPAATTTDADLLVPKTMKFKKSIDIAAIMEQNGFIVEQEHASSLMRFIHEDFKFEFLTNAGAKSEENVYRFKNLNLTAQELHFMNIPLSYNFTIPFRDISVRLPEPEAFTLHKLIISQRRINPLKKEKDIATAKGLFEYFEANPNHLVRLQQIYDEFPKGWKSKVNSVMVTTAIELPINL